ncbi:HepT-like ribonuclease domain-containing protein [Deinococcus alpinitundrae]|uniref:HepT-like ribonuclease domain-containing protein n=1 Tax=Deinococcus alpinitundrae TaxID=468913 RepID=UPI00137AE313|nr:HepT-like ribonuclease domain-containing protein [Deinococcus alpinitundrae]
MTAPHFKEVRPDLTTVLSLIREREEEWQALGVTRVRVFGSVARQEAGAESDVDVLLDFAPGAGLLTLARAREFFERLLGHRTDAVTEAALKPPLKREVLLDAVDARKPQLHPPRDSRKRWKWRIHELLSDIAALRSYTAPHTLESFAADPLHFDAVLLRLLRIGEGTKYLPQRLQDLHPEVPWATLRDVRNLVAHDYFGLDPALVWVSATREFPALRPLLQEMAGEGEE